jgi:hypothetical protein
VKRGFRSALRLGAAALALLLLGHFLLGLLWWSPKTTVAVTDGKSGDPVAGAVVVASWYITGLEGYVLEVIGTEEAVTGPDGVAVLPGWGPRLSLAKYSSGLVFTGGMGEEQPLIYVLGDGYLPATEFAHRLGSPEPGDGRVRVKLEQIDADKERYERTVQAVMSSLIPVYVGRRCMCKRIPRAVNLLERMYAPLRSRDIDGKAPPFKEIARESCRPLPAYMAED